MSIKSGDSSFVDEELATFREEDEGGEDRDFDESDVTSSVSNSTRSLPEAYHRTELLIDPNAIRLSQKNNTSSAPSSASSSSSSHPALIEYEDISRMSFFSLQEKVQESLATLKKFSLSVEFEKLLTSSSSSSEQMTLLKMLVSFLNYSPTEIPTNPSEIMAFSKLVLIRIESYTKRLNELFDLKQISLEQKIRLLPVVNEVKARSILVLRGIACLAVSVTSVDVCEFEKQSGEYPYLLGMKISPFFGMVTGVAQPAKPDHRTIIHDYVLEKIRADGYRIRDMNICQETMTPERHKTRFWKPLETIKEYVWKSFSSVAQRDVYEHFRRIGDAGMRTVVEMITNKVDDVARVVPLGNYRSFRNGIYKMDNKSVFYLYTDPMCPTDVCTECYIDQVFDPVWMKFESPLQIPTPHFDAFLRTQNISTRTRYMRDGVVVRDEKNEDVSMQNVYISFLFMMGRLLRPIFHLNDVGNKIYSDNLQRVLIIVGKPGSGKSTIINLIRAMFHSSNVATIAANADKNFGLENFRSDQVKLGVCYELAKNFNITPATIKSMVAGEKVPLNGKNLSIMDTDWNVPLVLLGNENEIPTEWGREGSNDGMVRRMSLFQFKNKPKTTDLMLHTRLEKELPAIMCKINRVYLEFSEIHGENIELKLFQHPYFTDAIKRFISQSSPIESFFSPENDQLSFGDFALTHTTMSDLWNFFLFYAENTLKMSRQARKYLHKRDFQEFVESLDSESRVQLVGPMSTRHVKTNKVRADYVVCGVMIESGTFNADFSPEGDVTILLDEKRRRRNAELAIDDREDADGDADEDAFNDDFIRHRLGKRAREDHDDDEDDDDDNDDGGDEIDSDYDLDF